MRTCKARRGTRNAGSHSIYGRRRWRWCTSLAPPPVEPASSPPMLSPGLCSAPLVSYGSCSSAAEHELVGVLYPSGGIAAQGPHLASCGVIVPFAHHRGDEFLGYSRIEGNVFAREKSRSGNDIVTSPTAAVAALWGSQKRIRADSKPRSTASAVSCPWIPEPAHRIGP